MVEGCMTSARCFHTFRSLLECCVPNFLVANNLALILARGHQGNSIDGYFSGDYTRDVVLK